MAALSRCHVVILKKTQLVSSRRNLDCPVSSFAGGRDDGVVHYYERYMSGAVKKKAMLLSKIERHSKAEPVIAFRDQVAVCVLASATLERLFARGGAVLEQGSGAASQRRELSPAGGSATSSERPRLESQWMTFSNANIERGLSELELNDPGEREGEVSEEQNSVVASRTQVAEKKAVNPEKVEACLHRLELRRKNLSTIPIRAFANFPRQTAYRESDHGNVEVVQGPVSTYLRDVSKIDSLTADEEVMLSKMIKIVHLTTEQRKKLERAGGHELTYHLQADILPVKVAKLDAKLHEFELAKVRMGVTRAIADDSRTLRLPVHVRESFCRNIRARARMLQDDDPATFDFTGEPSIPCDSCKGRGWLVCDFCEGQKVNVQTKKNRIYRRCPSCRAAGVVICPRCKVFKCVSFPDDRDAASSV